MVVDDQEMIRAGLRAILEPSPDIEVVADMADGLAALRALDTTAVDVVLMDLRMPGIDGVEATRRLRQRLSAAQTKVIVLTTFDQDENVLAALRAGANGSLSKGVGPRELVAGIVEVAHGGGALSAKAAAALIDHVADSGVVPVDPLAVARFDYLTAREREIVSAAARGLSNPEIAGELFISQLTVKTHLNRAMAKVDAHDRAALITLAYKAGIRP